MNEQLIVKNFGPITDATVDFKRVTVFIGPTGGGKSTLAKLMTIYKDFNQTQSTTPVLSAYEEFNLQSYFEPASSIRWEVSNLKKITTEYLNGEIIQRIGTTRHNPLSTQSLQQVLSVQTGLDSLDKAMYHMRKVIQLTEQNEDASINGLRDSISNLEKVKSRTRVSLAKDLGLTESELDLYTKVYSHWPCYVPAERQTIIALNKTWPRLLEEKVSLPKVLLDFASNFIEASSDIEKMSIPFFSVEYHDSEERGSTILLPNGKAIPLDAVASGIQSVTPMLVLLEHLSRNTEQAQSFIIEEPELNLYPTAQRDLVYWLLEKCTQGDNDLTITTHSPYVLSALNLALYAGKVATLFPHQRQKVAKIIPEKYWLKADEYSAYHVAGGGVKSIFDSKTGLLSESQLDEVSGHFADVFDRLTDLRVPEKKAPAKAKPAKK